MKNSRIIIVFLFLSFTFTITSSAVGLDNEDIGIVLNDSMNNLHPNVFEDNNKNLWVVYCNDVETKGNIWATYTNDSYSNWVTPFAITTHLEDDWNSAGFVDKDGTIWIFWESNRERNFDIWYRKSTDNGKN